MRAVAPILFLASIAMSACTLNSPYVDDYNAKLDTHTRPLIAELNASTATALTTTPTENTASLSGTFFIPTTTTITNAAAIAGQVDMDANFASGTLSGRMTDFVEVQSTSDGTLTGTDMYGRVDFAGTISVGTGTADDIAAAGTGSMRATNGTTYDLNTGMAGDFYRRPGADLAAVGTVSLTANSGGSTVTSNGVYFITE